MMNKRDIEPFMEDDYTLTIKDEFLEIKFHTAFQDEGDVWQLWAGAAGFVYNCGICIIGGLSSQRSTYKRPELSTWLLKLLTYIMFNYYGELLYTTNGNHHMEAILAKENWIILRDAGFKNPNTSKPITMWYKKRVN